MEKITAPRIMSTLVLCIRTCLSSLESHNRCFRFSLNSLTFSRRPQGLSTSPPTTTSTDCAKSPISVLCESGIGTLADMELWHTQFQKAISNLKTRSATRKIRRHFHPARYILGRPPRRCTIHPKYLGHHPWSRPEAFSGVLFFSGFFMVHTTVLRPWHMYTTPRLLAATS
jgi:hypothetical protein